MMKLKLYQVDAFTENLFSGNPAAVIPLKKRIPDELMQKLAMENNLAETAFFTPSINKKADFDIRWFTPALEINLCGHATLASAYVIFEILKTKKKKVVFDSKSGLLTVRKDLQSRLSVAFRGLMDFPSWPPERITEYPPELLTSLGNPEIAGVYKNREYMVELINEEAVKRCSPDFSLMKKVDRMIIITAPGKKVDFVSRFFAPAAGIDEDPVTGSAHSQLIPFWSEKLGKKIMQAKQLSQRGGTVYCEQKGERVIMGGKCVFYMKGEIIIS
jgi:PhzF family phenazine biosynthesis protein